MIGAGPAGLTAAYCLTKETPSVTRPREGPDLRRRHLPHRAATRTFSFDIGGHRFFSKSKEVVDLWHEILPDDFIERPRLSRIFYGGKYLFLSAERVRSAEESRRFHERGLHAVLRVRARRSRSPSRDASTTGCATSSASGCSTSSSRPTPKKCGACRATRSPPTGPRSASRASTCGVAVTNALQALAQAQAQARRQTAHGRQDADRYASSIRARVPA